MAQVVECFLSKHEVLSSYCYTHKKKKKEKEKKKKGGRRSNRSTREIVCMGDFS
jgi:hypothetical protein